MGKKSRGKKKIEMGEEKKLKLKLKLKKID
jgi:hypothetical protein